MTLAETASYEPHRAVDRKSDMLQLITSLWGGICCFYYFLGHEHLISSGNFTHDRVPKMEICYEIMSGVQRAQTIESEISLQLKLIQIQYWWKDSSRINLIAWVRCASGNIWDLATRWRHFKNDYVATLELVANLAIDGASCIYYKFALVPKLATMLSTLHCQSSWYLYQPMSHHLSLKNVSGVSDTRYIGPIKKGKS